MECFTYNRVDRAFSQPFAAVARFLVAALGISQYTIARVALLAATAVCAVAELQHLTVWNGIQLAIDVWVVYVVLWDIVPSWEDAADRLSSDVLPAVVLRWRSFGWLRPLTVAFIALNAASRQWLLVGADLLWPLGVYAVTLYGPRPPPWWQTARTALTRRFAPVAA